MRQYEIILIVDVAQEDRLVSLSQKYRELVEKHQGLVHRFENWGRRRLSYPIQDRDYATYLLYNVEAPADCVDELVRQFRINDSVLRHLLIRREEAITGKSVIMQEIEEASERARDSDAESASGKKTPFGKPRQGSVGAPAADEAPPPAKTEESSPGEAPSEQPAN